MQQRPSQTSRDIAGKTPSGILPERVRPYLGLARLVLLIEQLAPLALTLYGIFGIFLVAAWFGLFRLLPAWLHLIVLIILLAGVVAALWHHLRRFRSPSRDAAIRRLERDSGLLHRPLTHLTDQAVDLVSDPAQQLLWAQYRARLLKSIGPLQLSAPQTDYVTRDPFALRALLLLLGVVGFIFAADLGWQRSMQALTPNFAGYVASDSISVDAWITPPDYTSQPPISLSTGNLGIGQRLLVPTGSKLLVQAQGIGAKAVLLANGSSSDFTMLDPLTQRIETVLKSGDRIAIEASGGTLAEWQVTIAPDLPPTAAFATAPSGTERGALRIDYQASDDYGVKDLRLYIQHDKQTIETPLVVPVGESKQPKGTAFLDFTANPLAGLQVELRLVARDALGQVGASAPVSMTLPERRFYHPIARALIEERKHLTAANIGNHDALTKIAQSLYAIGEQPAAYDDNVSVYLAINLAWRGLVGGRPFDEVSRSDLQQLLWDTALDIEDGGVSLAMRDLRRLQRELQDALAHHASPEEIERLMNKLQQAMNDYVRNLQQQLQRAIAKGMQPGRVNPNSLHLSQNQLNDMLNDARRMAESGSAESAQQMLDRLQQMLEGLQAGVSPRMRQNGSGQDQQMMNDLAHIMQDQQKLLQDSFRMQRQQSGAEAGQGQGQGEGDGQGIDPSQNAGAQEALRRALGKLMQDVGNAAGSLPQGLGQAEQAMRRATQSLEQGDPSGAGEAQNDALSKLQKGMKELGQILGNKTANGGNGQGPRPPFGPDSNGDNRGEDSGKPDTSGGMKLDGDLLQRSQKIFEELRNRRNNPDRPKQEKDYLDRLLRQF
jgi:uncharacterized protein (TIGR02302 family)